MSSPTTRSAKYIIVSVAIFLAILFLFVSTPASPAQESLIAPMRMGTTNVLDLETLTLQQTMNVAGYQAYAAVGTNPRLTYIGATNGAYLSVVDFTLGREINRIYGVCPYAQPSFTSDKKYLMVEDQCDGSLKFVDTSTQKLVRKIALSQYMGTGATGTNTGTIVVVGTKAYVTTVAPDASRPTIAVIDLRTYKVKSIAIPAGYFENSGVWSPNAGSTPDGKYVVMAQSSPDYQTYHLLFVNTATDQFVMDKTLAFDPYGLLITGVNSPGNNYGYLLGLDTNGNFSATLIDLNNGSPTFGQILTATEVQLQNYIPINDFTAVLNPEGTRLVVGGHKGGPNPNPNVVLIDTTQMLHNPSGAIKNTAIVANGVNPHGFAIANITSTPPPTAPTVTMVSPASISNSQDNPITVTGTNFAAGALVRVGNTPSLAATVDSSTSLHVTVPQNWPAQATLDVVVTNPNIAGAPAQQYQSGLGVKELTILPTSAFQPNYQFTALAFGDWTVAVYEPSQQTMIDVPNTLGPHGVTFNADGKEIYSASEGTRGVTRPAEAAAWSTSDGTLQAELPFSAGTAVAGIGEIAIASSLNPLTGTPVVFVPVRANINGQLDVVLEEVDTSTSTPKLVQSIPSGLGLPPSSGLTVEGGAATPDGKYVYVNYYYYDQSGTQYAFIAIFDVVHATVTPLSTNSLGVVPIQYSEMTVTPDGQSLLMAAQSIIPSAGPIGVFDIGANPLSPALVSTIYGVPQTSSGTLSFVSWKVVGNHLFALDGNFGIVVAFNFDRKNLNFTELGVYAIGHPNNNGQDIGVSPDGALIYVPILGYDMVTVLDAVKLANQQAPFITNLGAFRGPLQVAVSPAPLNPAPLQITTATLPSGTQGVAYSATLASTGGVPPYIWQIISGNLPSGLTLSPMGQITGIPSGSSSSFTVQLTDSRMHTTQASLSITIQGGASLQITTSSLPTGPINQPYYATLAATGGVPPYTWSLTQGSLPAGLNPLSPSGVISGTPTTPGTSSFTVQVADSAIPAAKKTAQLSITINSAGNPGVLSGHYAFAMSGFDQQPEQWTLAGSFVADGNGNITNGVVDENGVVSGPTHTTFTGTYAFGSTGLGTMNLNIVGVGNMTYAFSIADAAGNGRIIQYQSGQGWAAGPLRRQDPNAFSLSSMAGTYSFGLTGISGKYQWSAAGEFAIDNSGNISNGLYDQSQSDGTYENGTLAGALGAVDPNTGRSTGQLEPTDKGLSNFAFYVVSATEFLCLQTDAGQGINNGTFLRQTTPGTFSSASLYGNAVFHQQSLKPPSQGGTSQAGVGIATADGKGIMAVIQDENDGGTLKHSTAYVSYTVASNGRGVFSNDQNIVYLVGQNLGFFVGGPGNGEYQLGFFEPQSAGPFSNASVLGNYGGGTLPPIDQNVPTEVDAASADGLGTITVSDYYSGGGGTGQDSGQQIQYNIAANGRGTISPDGDVLYIVSPSKVFTLHNNQDPRLSVAEGPSALQITTASLPSGTQGVFYSAALSAVGGSFPYSWQIASGSLPSGLTLSTAGVISGVPTALGTSNFTVKVIDGQMHTASAALSITIQQGALLQITTATFPNAPVNQLYYVLLTVSGGVPPYTWSVVQGSLPTGLALSAGTVSGTPTAPGTSTFTLQVVDSGLPQAHASKQFGITVNTYGNPGLLSGHYVLATNGYDHVPDEITFVGSFVTDGAGNLTGVGDFNGVHQGPEFDTFTGTYWMGSDNLGEMTINIPAHGNVTLAFSLDSTGSGRIIQFQNHEGWTSGVLRKQDASAFKLSNLAGTYVFGNPGFDWQDNRQVSAGLSTLDSAGNMSGSGDSTGDGNSKSFSFTGTMSNIDPNTGRTTAVMNGSDTSHFAYYVVSANEFLGTSTDNAQQTHNSVQTVTALRQANPGHYNNASLNGNTVYYSQAIEPPSMGGGGQAKVGLLTADGKGGAASIEDANNDGTMTFKPGSGNYSIAPNGRGTIGDTILYLAGQNTAFSIDGPPKNKAELGFLQPQTGGPFSNASFSGNYYGGTLDPVEFNSGTEVDWIYGDGAGGMIGGYKSEDSGGIDQSFGKGVWATLNFSSNGRGVASFGGVAYAISPDKFVILPDNQYPKLMVIEH